MLRCLNCVLCAPNGLRGVMDLARGPLGAFQGRFVLLLPKVKP